MSESEHLTEAMRGILEDHAARYPLMQLQDLYKLLHQAARGSEHAIRDPQAAHRWMEAEVAALGDGPREPLVDPISPDGLTRIHLRPYVQSGASLDALLEAFIHTAQHFAPETERLPDYGRLAVQMAQAGKLPFDSTGIEQFWMEMAGQGFPAAHHSAQYAAAYRPAYRVVLWELLRDSLPSL